jgi:hypothetical protein
LLQTEVPTDPQAIANAVKPYRRTLRRAGHEAGALSPWLQAELLAPSRTLGSRPACHLRGSPPCKSGHVGAAQ